MHPRASSTVLRFSLAILALTSVRFDAHGQVPTDSARLERLVDLGRVWGTVKFFHPYLAYHRVNWDSALVATIPKVEAADDLVSYSAAVQDMLDALEDLATRVVEPAPNPATTADDDNSVVHWTADSILVATLNRTTLGDDFWQIAERLRGLQDEVLAAGGILFDLRSTAGAGGFLNLDYLFIWSGLDRTLIRTPVSTPGQRTRIHMGYAPERGMTSGGYYSAFSVRDGTLLEPGDTATSVPIVFLTDNAGGIPSVAVALQQSGSAAIVSEGQVTDAAFVDKYTMTLSDGVTVEVRLGEIVYADGTGGLAPNVSLPADGDWDEAIGIGLALVRDFDVKPAARQPLPPAAVPVAAATYDEEAYPSREKRMLAGIRIWAVIEHFFPYKDLMDANWDDVLREYLPLLEAAPDAVSYHQAVAEMYAHISDTHGFVRSEVLSDYLGAATTPLYLRWIEDMPVVAGFFDEEAARSAGVEIGDVVLSIDGEDAIERARRLAKYVAASTPQARMWRVTTLLTSGPEGENASLTLRNRDGESYDVLLPRHGNYREGYTSRSGDISRVLGNGIGYADLDRLNTNQVAGMFEEFRDTEAIIFDMRGYPNGTAWAIAPYLADEPAKAAALFDRPMLLGPGDWDRQSYTFTQRIPEPGPGVVHYAGRTVMLIDERTISQAEHTGLFFEAANGTTFIGSRTNGANGDVTNFSIPGGISLLFTGQSVRHADGRQLQRIGLVPHLEVEPTIAGIREGRDEVLEAAIAYILGDAADAD